MWKPGNLKIFTLRKFVIKDQPMSRWKAGQCVTINGKRYRVTRSKECLVTCSICVCFNEDGNKYPCSQCINVFPPIIPGDCYFEEIKPKS